MNKLFMKHFLLVVFLTFLSTHSLNAQSKYLDSTKTVFGVLGGIGFSEFATSKSLGGIISLKGALDFGIQIGSTVNKKEINDSIDDNFSIESGESGTSISAQGYLYMQSQSRGDKVNFGFSFGASNVSYENAELNTIVAGLHLSRRETEDGLAFVTFNFEPLVVLKNEFTSKETGRTFTGQPFFSGAISIGISRKLKDSKIFYLEPGIVYEDAGQSLSGALTIGLIF